MSNEATARNEAKMVEEFGRPAAEGKKLVRNLMSQKVIEIDANTPLACNPASETYWCM